MDPKALARRSVSALPLLADRRYTSDELVAMAGRPYTESSPARVLLWGVLEEYGWICGDSHWYHRTFPPQTDQDTGGASPTT